MAHTITVQDESLTGEVTPALGLEFLTDEITVRELIRERVFQEVKDHNARPRESFRGLVQPAPDEEALNGRGARAPKMLDWKPQFEAALAAYEANGFLVLVNDHQTASLDEQIRVSMDTVVNFIKLTPLVGG